VQSIGVTHGAEMIREGDTIKNLLPGTMLLLSDTSTGMVINDSTKWTFFDNSASNIHFGKDIGHQLVMQLAVYRVTKRVKGPINETTMTFYIQVGQSSGGGNGEQMIKISKSYNASIGKYDELVGFNDAYITGNRSKLYYVIDDGQNHRPVNLDSNTYQMVNGKKYLTAHIFTFDSTRFMWYGGWYDTTQPVANWNFANITTSYWYVTTNGINKMVVMDKDGDWYRYGTITYDPAPGGSGDDITRRYKWRWESVVIAGVNYYNFFSNHKSVPSGDNSGPYVRYKIPGTSNNWNVTPATYIGSTGFAKITLPKSVFTGNGAAYFEVYSGGVEMDYRNPNSTFLVTIPGDGEDQLFGQWQ
jgi:hypothetical protein